MEHSKEYQDFIKYLHSSPREKMDGYRPDLLNRIEKWERDEVEDIIWEYFNCQNLTELACYLPQLTKYDGIGALKAKLAKYTIPSDGSRELARVLYDTTGDGCYLDVFKENYEKSKSNLYIIVTQLSYCKDSQKKLDLLCDMYLTCDEELAVDCAARAIIYYIKGIDHNQISLTEEIKYIKEFAPMIDALTKCKKEERVNQLKKIL